jgi:hypothetical protein
MGTQSRSDRNASRQSAYERQRLQRERGKAALAARNEVQAAERRAADAVIALETRWNTRADALRLLSEVGRAIVRIRCEEDQLRSQRDELIDALRSTGESWNSLASRTGLSRQALIKRRGDAGGRI